MCVSVCVSIYAICEFRERTDAYCITEAIPFICFATSTSLFCHTENFMQNKQTVLKTLGKFFIAQPFFSLACMLVAIKENEDRQRHRPTIGVRVAWTLRSGVVR